MSQVIPSRDSEIRSSLVLHLLHIIFQKILAKKFWKETFFEINLKKLNTQTLEKKGRVNKCYKVLTELSESEDSSFKVYSVYKPLFLFHSFLTFFHDSAYEKKFPNKSYITGDPDWLFFRMQDLWFHFVRIAGLGYIFKLIELYSFFMERGSKEGYESLIEHIKILKDDCEQAALIYRWILNTTLEDCVKLINGNSIQNEPAQPSWLDTTLPCVYQLLNHWTYFFDGKNFDVVHDDSWVLKKRDWIITSLKGNPEEKQRILKSKVRDKCFYIYPDYLPIHNFEFKNSENYAALQIADLLAGLINEFAVNLCAEKSSNEHLDLIIDLIAEDSFIYMFPTINYARIEDRQIICSKNVRFM
ncbi:Uncharacterised protein [Legionella beliardensis]|uniref:Uncharacterized protein n=1 Tax=Legionella beliardensis TaxID=91822 RepID=A0A378JNN4_9GAMM|nr:Uncharacterised protein [Legionella beliardensis]